MVCGLIFTDGICGQCGDDKDERSSAFSNQAASKGCEVHDPRSELSAAVIKRMRVGHIGLGRGMFEDL